ncbi:resolvase, partial [Salmonella enterica subsp. enterica serovar Kentucky]|nr:resolvase [Salmonella enterica subsp. enterica serovar Kentucky]
MTGQRIGYIRVSTFDQNPERQLEGVKVDRAFSDKASGKDVKRPQLEALISFARTGDTVVVHSMDRLARNLDDLRRIVQTLTQRGVHIEFVKEGTVAKLAMRQPFVLFKGLTFQKLCLPGAFRPGDHQHKMP